VEDYKAMYDRLYNRVSQAIEVLQQAQIESENTFITDKLPVDQLELLEPRENNEPPE